MNTTFTAALGGMAKHCRWFVWQLRWDGAAGKFRKQPCSLDGARYPIDASQPANWHSYDTSRAAVAKLDKPGADVRYALGYWLTVDSGYWFLDLDHASDGQQWQPLATDFAASFPGAMVEVSSSGRGLHIIGTGPVPQHRNKPPADIAARLLPLQLELYTQDRGIAFGFGEHVRGCADTTYELTRLAADYFPPRVRDHAAMTGGGFAGTDDALIEKMLAARASAAATFGGKATLQQLWRGEVPANSEHDMALASHLAWWTGADAARVDRLMRRSRLVRDKWNERRPGGTYLSTTIAKACEHCESCYREPVPLPLIPHAHATIKNAADLLRQDFKPVQWAIRDLIPEGVTILSGDPKIGKSWLVYQAALAVATGSSLWRGREPETQGDALMLALEDNDRRLRRRLDKLLTLFPGKTPNRLHYVTDWPRAEAGVAAIAEFLRKHPDCRIVVIDTISAFRDNDPGRKSAYAHDYAVGEMLKPLAREFNCAIVLVMHNRKQGSEDVMHKVSGTQGMTGSVDNVLILERGRGEFDAILHVDGRDIEQQQELALSLDDGKWSFLGKAEDVQRTKERAAVLEALVSLRGCGTAKEIHEAMGGCAKLAAVKMRLSRMHKAGEIEKSGSIYTLTDSGLIFTPVPPPLHATHKLPGTQA